MNRNGITNHLSEIEKRMIYVYQEKTLLNEAALFADETCYFRKPAEPEPGDLVTFRFRTGRDNVDKVVLHINSPITKSEGCSP